jgi:predicted dehydrogenase
MVGAGNRGYLAYGAYALRHPDQVRFIAVAEPDEGRRLRFARAHGIPAERQFSSWDELASRPPLAPALVNATMDRTHHPSALALLEVGYDMLLEKPMATTPQQCVELVQMAERRRRMLQIGHVLRYAPFFRTIYQLAQSGRLGELVSIDWRENLASWHYAHSFVRGNWGNSDRTGPMLLSKCCHDLDLLVWMMGQFCERIASFGSLTHFTHDSVGPEIPMRCTDGCPVADECPYYAPRFYFGLLQENPESFAINAMTLDHTPGGVQHALETGRYGRCVYRCDNNVVDHQVVLMEFPNRLAASLTMQGCSDVEGRTVRIDGRRATLRANEARSEVVVADHQTGAVETIHTSRGIGGHGGGDEGIMQAFVNGLRGGEGILLTSARESVESHLIAFAAEEARLSRTVVEMAPYRQAIEDRISIPA